MIKVATKSKPKGKQPKRPPTRVTSTAKQLGIWVPPPKLPGSDDQLDRVRRICFSFPDTTERLSHGAPTFFVNNRVYAMFVNNHHNDGHLAVWIPTLPGDQMVLIETWPRRFYKPPYVGVKGWVGVELDAIGDDELTRHLYQAWQLIEPKKRGRNIVQ